MLNVKEIARKLARNTTTSHKYLGSTYFFRVEGSWLMMRKKQTRTQVLDPDATTEWERAPFEVQNQFFMHLNFFKS